jgi:hypothetical protein
MQPLTRSDLWKLEDYARERPAFRTRVLAHKKDRTVPLGDHLILLFEDRLTVHYQVQEMLRIERVYEPEGIDDELAAYNPLVPDGGNLKATLLIEYPDPDERKRELARLHGVEHRITLVVDGHAAVDAIADEDLDRSNDEKTSAVHFLRFELDASMRAAWRAGADVHCVVDHPNYRARVALSERARAALGADFD